MRFAQTCTIALISYLLFQCTTSSPLHKSLQSQLAPVASISGKAEYIDSPFVTAGDRAYLVGHQNGTFPDLGWHIKGEMGGVWMHPIKLLDGFTASIVENGTETCLAAADSFINYPMANKHIYRDAISGIYIERFQFVPDGKPAVVVEYSFKNTGKQTRTVTFSVVAFSDLRPTWLGERTNMIDSKDSAEWEAATNAWVFKDSANTWFATVGSTQQTVAHKIGKNGCHYTPIGPGIAATATYEIAIPAGETVNLPFVIAGSVNSKAEAISVLRDVQQNAVSLLTQKQTRYQQLAQQSKLTIPNKKMEQTFRWVKYNTDWLIRDVPGIGRGISAGIPDYPWWFGVDSEYTLQAALAIGRTDIVYETIDLIHQLSEKRNGNGRIVHEVSTNGAVFNEGNINETPQFASLIWKVYQWTGDRPFLEKYYPTVQKGLNWLMTETDKDGNLFPDGFGMMEIHGMDSEMIDVAVYTQKAFADAAEMAKTVGKPADEKRYSDLAGKLKTKINTDFWVEEANSYADFIGTKTQALRLVDDAIIRADTLAKPWAVAELRATKQHIQNSTDIGKKGYVLHHNWVVNTPMEVGIADEDKAIKALQTAKKYVNPFGAFVTGIDRDESSATETGSFAKKMKIFTYTGAVMTLPTGVAAIAENNYGRPNEALDYLNRLTTSFSYALPGSMYEVSPDFGMMTQAWNLYSYAVPIVGQFFGIKPTAARKEIVISPQMPDAWNEAKLENVKIADNSLTMSYSSDKTSTKITLNQTVDWQLKLQFPTGKYSDWRVNGKVVKPTVYKKMTSIVLSGNENVVEVELVK